MFLPLGRVADPTSNRFNNSRAALARTPMSSSSSETVAAGLDDAMIELDDGGNDDLRRPSAAPHVLVRVAHVDPVDGVVKLRPTPVTPFRVEVVLFRPFKTLAMPSVADSVGEGVGLRSASDPGT